MFFALHREFLLLLGVILRSGDGSKSLYPSNDHIVIAAGTMDDEDISVFIPTGDDPHMGVIRVKYEIAGKRVCPGDCCAIVDRGLKTTVNSLWRSRYCQQSCQQTVKFERVSPNSSRQRSTSGSPKIA